MFSYSEPALDEMKVIFYSDNCYYILKSIDHKILLISAIIILLYRKWN
jgi:hypothetical protein